MPSINNLEPLHIKSICNTDARACLLNEKTLYDKQSGNNLPLSRVNNAVIKLPNSESIRPDFHAETETPKYFNTNNARSCHNTPIPMHEDNYILNDLIRYNNFSNQSTEINKQLSHSSAKRINSQNYQLSGLNLFASSTPTNVSSRTPRPTVLTKRSSTPTIYNNNNNNQIYINNNNNQMHTNMSLGNNLHNPQNKMNAQNTATAVVNCNKLPTPVVARRLSNKPIQTQKVCSRAVEYPTPHKATAIDLDFKKSDSRSNFCDENNLLSMDTRLRNINDFGVGFVDESSFIDEREKDSNQIGKSKYDNSICCSNAAGDIYCEGFITSCFCAHHAFLQNSPKTDQHAYLLHPANNVNTPVQANHNLKTSQNKCIGLDRAPHTSNFINSAQTNSFRIKNSCVKRTLDELEVLDPNNIDKINLKSKGQLNSEEQDDKLKKLDDKIISLNAQQLNNNRYDNFKVNLNDNLCIKCSHCHRVSLPFNESNDENSNYNTNKYQKNFYIGNDCDNGQSLIYENIPPHLNQQDKLLQGQYINNNNDANNYFSYNGNAVNMVNDNNSLEHLDLSFPYNLARVQSKYDDDNIDTINPLHLINFDDIDSDSYIYRKQCIFRPRMDAVTTNYNNEQNVHGQLLNSDTNLNFIKHLLNDEDLNSKFSDQFNHRPSLLVNTNNVNYSNNNRPIKYFQDDNLEYISPIPNNRYYNINREYCNNPQMGGYNLKLDTRPTFKSSTDQCKTFNCENKNNIQQINFKNKIINNHAKNINDINNGSIESFMPAQDNSERNFIHNNISIPPKIASANNVDNYKNKQQITQNSIARVENAPSAMPDNVNLTKAIEELNSDIKEIRNALNSKKIAIEKWSIKEKQIEREGGESLFCEEDGGPKEILSPKPNRHNKGVKDPKKKKVPTATLR